MSFPIPEAHMRSAVLAAVRLRVIPAVFDVFILCLTDRAHRKPGHGGAGSVVRNVLYDRKARSAIGTIDKWICKTPVLRIHKLSSAILTDSDIRGDQHIVFKFFFTVAYFKKLLVRDDFHVTDRGMLHLRHRRKAFGQLM